MDVDEFFYGFEGKQRELLLFLHGYLANDLNLTAKLRYQLPFYYGNSWICYLNPVKKEGVELAFTRGNELYDAHKILESKGRKQVFSIALQSIKDVDQMIKDTIQEAILLDETKRYQPKRQQ